MYRQPDEHGESGIVAELIDGGERPHADAAFIAAARTAVPRLLDALEGVGQGRRSPEPWVVGISTDDLFGEPWPVYRLRDMRDPADAGEVEANRRLMEAAPALLAACESALEYLGWRDVPQGPLGHQLAEAIRRATTPEPGKPS